MAFQHILFVVLLAVWILHDTVEMKPIRDQPSVRLMNAVHGEVLMPVTGLGTGAYGRPDGSGGEYWGPEQGHNATLAWLKAGGRRIDTAGNYGSLDGVGTGWKASGVPRSEIFFTSKVEIIGYDKVLQEFADILTSLQTEYVDLLLIHAPGGRGDLPCKQGESTWRKCRTETWQALESIFKQEKVRYRFHLVRSYLTSNSQS
jgi:diketogulonate reductase-like aldo/keto reductase